MAESISKSVIRPPQVSGTFYPADPVELRDMLTELFEAVPRSQPLNVAGLICPHAGYAYSGITAAHSYATLRSRVSNPPAAIIIVSPSHREYFRGCSIYPGDGYATPLGTMPVHEELRASILEMNETSSDSNILTATNRGHGPEHALEVQLPFLQFLFGDIPIVPIVMGDQSPEYCFGLGHLLSKVVKSEDVVIVASTDLSHFHTSQLADQIDTVFIDYVRAFDEAGLMNALDGHKTEACGGGPTVAVMTACRDLGAARSTILDHRNSGLVTHDLSSVVGYLSAALHL